MTTIPFRNLETLRHLQRTCCDGAASFRIVARLAATPELVELFTTLSEQRKIYETELNHYAINHGEALDDVATLLTRADDKWSKVFSEVNPGDDHRLLEVCDEEECTALQCYRLALEEVTTLSTRGLIRAQIGGVEWGQGIVSDLRHSIIYRSRSAAA